MSLVCLLVGRNGTLAGGQLKLPTFSRSEKEQLATPFTGTLLGPLISGLTYTY